MRLHPKKLTLMFMLTLMITAFNSFSQGSLDIKITNIRKNSGKIVVEIYNSKAGWLKTPFKKLELSLNQDVQTASFQVPYGKYAITIQCRLVKGRIALGVASFAYLSRKHGASFKPVHFAGLSV